MCRHVLAFDYHGAGLLFQRGERIRDSATNTQTVSRPENLQSRTGGPTVQLLQCSVGLHLRYLVGMAEFLNRGKEEGLDVLMSCSPSVLITLVVLFKQIQSNAMKMVQGRLTSFYSFSRETDWVSIIKYFI